jgi:uncharacterized protein (TIGR02996 family)
VTFDDTPAALRAKWEANKAGRASSIERDDELGEHDLEAALRAHPDELDTYLVYADWLADRGDEWGQLITVQHALETLPRFGAGDRRDELSRRETLLRFQLSGRLWGPIGEQVYDTSTQRYYCDLIDAGWRWGFLHTARIARTDVLNDLLAGLAEAPVAIVLRRLSIHTVIDTRRARALAAALLRVREHAPWLELDVNDGGPIALDGDVDAVRAQLCARAEPRYDDIDE